MRPKKIVTVQMSSLFLKMLLMKTTRRSHQAKFYNTLKMTIRTGTSIRIRLTTMRLLTNHNLVLLNATRTK